MTDFTLIIQQTVQQLKAEVNVCLEAKGMSVSHFHGLKEVFCDPCKTEPFKQLDSRFLQERFYRQHLHLLVSIYSAPKTVSIIFFSVQRFHRGFCSGRGGGKAMAPFPGCCLAICLMGGVLDARLYETLICVVHVFFRKG